MPLDRPNEETLFSQVVLAINQTSTEGPGLSPLPALCEALVKSPTPYSISSSEN